MKNKSTFEFENSGIKSYLIDNIGVIEAKENIFSEITDLDEIASLFSLLEAAEYDPRISALILFAEPHTTDDLAYQDFINKICRMESMDCNKVKIENKVIRSREITILNRLIKQITSLPKIVIMALQGGVVTPFAGISLATDFRFASDNFSYNLSHKKYGLHPSGGLAYFLPLFVGRGKAIDILLRNSVISGKEALELGLINQIYPETNFKQKCIDTTKELCKIPPKVVKSTKGLIYHANSSFDKYITEESRYIT